MSRPTNSHTGNFAPKTKMPGIINQNPVIMNNSKPKDNFAAAGGAIMNNHITRDAGSISHSDRHKRMVSAEKILTDEFPQANVTSVKIQRLTSALLEKLSVVNVTALGDMDQPGAVNDPIMGVVDKDVLCQSCEGVNWICPGHLGHIQLPFNMIPSIYIKTVEKILPCICRYCSGLLVTEKWMEMNNLLSLKGDARLKGLAALCEKNKKSVMSCIRSQPVSKRLETMPGAFSPLKKAHGQGESAEILITRECKTNPIYKTAGRNIMYTDIESEDGDHGEIMSMEDLFTLLDNVSEEDIRLMGFSEGQNLSSFIIDKIPVMPPVARPQAFQDGESKPDQITKCYVDIVKEVAIFRDSRESDKTNNINNIWKFASEIVESKEATRSSNMREPVQSIMDRITGKEGTVRGSSMGKRVNFSMRTVISPWSALRFGEIGCSESFRSAITVPEVVSVGNIDHLNAIYAAEPCQVTFVSPHDNRNRGNRFKVSDKFRQRYPTLQLGDEVDRWLEEGDAVLFGRQPTLHKLALQGYQVRFCEGKVFRLHMANTKQHNADFDGDEGTIHVMQTPGSRAEAYYLANARCNIGDSNGGVSAGLAYNGLISVYILTDAKTRLLPEQIKEATDILTCRVDFPTLPERLAKHGVDPLSGRALFSYLLPANFYYNTGGVLIKDGVLIKGQISSTHVGPKPRSIIHYIWRVNQARAADFITDGTFLTDWFIYNWGFSIGYVDCVPLDDSAVEHYINSEIYQIQTLMKQLENSMDLESATSFELDFLENNNRSLLNRTAAIGKAIAENPRYIRPDNPLILMADSGAKGGPGNTAQITGMAGQQFIRGQRPVQNLTHTRFGSGKRTLPYFAPGSKALKACGFVRNSFVRGLSVAETVFHHKASRIGIVEGAVKTSDTGSIHHRTVKVFEDTKIGIDGSVRNATNVMFSPIFGEGFEASRLIKVNSEALGPVMSFVDLYHESERLNLGSDFGVSHFIRNGQQLAHPENICHETPNPAYGIATAEVKVVESMPQVHLDRTPEEYQELSDQPEKLVTKPAASIKTRVALPQQRVLTQTLPKTSPNKPRVVVKVVPRSTTPPQQVVAQPVIANPLQQTSPQAQTVNAVRRVVVKPVAKSTIVPRS